MIKQKLVLVTMTLFLLFQTTKMSRMIQNEQFRCPIGYKIIQQKKFKTCSAVCGDGIIVGHEQCDDGDKNDKGGCSKSCQVKKGWWCKKQIQNKHRKLINKCYETQIRNCIKKGEKKTCKQCDEDYQLGINKNICFKKIPNCQQIDQTKSTDSSSVCAKCYPTHTPSSDFKICYPNIPGCQQIDQTKSTDASSVCAKCYPTHTLSSDSQSCTLNPLCKTGQIYSVQALKCVKLIPKCQVYTSTSTLIVSQCVTCISGYKLSIDKSRCVKIIPNCVIYNFFITDIEKPLCTSCQQNYIPSNDQSKCLLIIKNCKDYDQILSTQTQSICINCVQGYQLINPSKCLPSILYCQILIANPQNIQSSLCQKCLPNYELSNDKLKCLPNSIPNCVDFNTINKICNKCDQNYFISSDKISCYPPINNCVRYHPTLPLCTICRPGFQLQIDGTKCIAVNKIGCTSIVNNNCISCKDGYFLSTDSQSCQLKNVDGCQQYGTNLNCLQCQDGYILSNDRMKCTPLFTFQFQVYTAIGMIKGTNSIPNGWRLVTQAELKKVQISYVHRMSKSTNYCYKQGYISANQNREISYTNTNNPYCSYYIIKVVIDPSHCLNFDGKVCSSCQDDYILSNDKTYCESKLVVETVIFTNLGQIKILGYTRDVLPKNWRALASQEVRLLKSHLDSVSENVGLYTFRIGTLKGSYGGYSLLDFISVDAGEYYTKVMEPNQIRFCDLYTSLDPMVCDVCETGFTMSADKKSCYYNYQCQHYSALEPKCF